VQEDAAIGRLYLPAEALARAGILITTPADVARHPLLPQVMAEVGAVAEQAFADTDAALAVCDRRAMRPARMMMKVYERALAHVREGGWRVMPPARGVRRAILRAEKLGIALYHALT
jgi:phytoene synthase